MSVETTVEDVISKIENEEIGWDNVQEVEISEHIVPGLREFANLKDTNQGALKVNINSEFGALDNEYFAVKNRNISGSITFMGRLLNRLTGSNIQDYLSEKYGVTKDSILVYQDTDSCEKTTKISVKGLYKITYENGETKYVDENEFQRMKEAQEF